MSILTAEITETLRSMDDKEAAPRAEVLQQILQRHRAMAKRPPLGTCADCPQSAPPAANSLPIPNQRDAAAQHVPAQPVLSAEDSRDTFHGVSLGTCADCPQSAPPAANSLPIPNQHHAAAQPDPAQPVLPTEDSRDTFSPFSATASHTNPRT
jgi:hypothetical protein